jgi:PKD repeat protein
MDDQCHLWLFQGVGDTANTPGGRSECTVTWVDMENNLWLYGGNNAPDDLWKYSIISNTWTWVKGSTSGTTAPVYGTMGIPSLTNTPGSRYNYAKWKDAQDNLWMFGGFGLSFYSPRNDLWKYNPASNEWTWMNGSNTSGDPGIYNSYCSPDSISNPKARFENRAVWTDGNGKFWMMGGLLDGINKNINDMWYYTPATNEWTWVSGDTIPNYTGFYGIQGTSNPSNNPSDRGGAVSWMDDQCHLWLFGGWSNGFNLKNDVWKFIPGDSCGACSLPALSASNTSLCEKFCIDFFDSSTNNPTSWQWQFPGGSPSSSTDQNPTNICYQVPGIFDVTLITTSANGNDTLTLSNYITVNTTPPFPTITQVGYTLTSSPATSYQWQLNAADIPGATSQSYIVLQSGTYTVIIGDSNGCVNSASKEVLITGIDAVNDDAGITIYPNPANGRIIIQVSSMKNGEAIIISIMNVLGKTVMEENVIWNDHETLDVENLASGVYLLILKNEKKKFVTRLFKE